MPRILLDQNAPLGLRNNLRDHEVITARYLGWHGLSNGDLIAAAEEHGFDILITADQNLQYQQNITARKPRLPCGLVAEPPLSTSLDLLEQ